MGDVDNFKIDAEELDSVISGLERCEGDLETLTGDLERQMATLHETFEGLAAQAHKEAHAQWTRGMRDMHAALSALRAASRQAHGNYTAAADSNTSMWQAFE